MNVEPDLKSEGRAAARFPGINFVDAHCPAYGQFPSFAGASRLAPKRRFYAKRRVVKWVYVLGSANLD
jgi:hypothetical protein